MPPRSLYAPSSRVLRKRALAVGVVALVALGACQQPAKKGAPPPPAPLPPLPSQYCHPQGTPQNANQYQAAFNGLFAANAKGWAGSDGGHPVRLDANRVLWLFSDTVIGRRAPDGSVPHMDRFANNGFVVQNGRCFTPFTNPIPAPQSGHWIWPIGADEHNGEIRVFGMQRRPGGSVGIYVRATVTRFSRANPSQRVGSTQGLGLPANNKGWGQTVAFDGQYVYAYGQTRRNAPNPPPFNLPLARHFVARAPVDSNLSSPSAWKYWAKPPELEGAEAGVEEMGVEVDVLDDDLYWVDQESQAKPMLFEEWDDPGEFHEEGGPAAAFSVVPRSGAFLASAINIDQIGHQLRTWRGDTPRGPWTRRGVAVNNTDHNTHWNYSGRVVFGIAPSPIAYWSIHPGSLNAILANSNLYRLRFAPPAGGSLL